ncbi:MAG TPA: methyltransferase domain-containing protein [Bryobacteraceae bacterium]|nr:methyltransferase domain-containing protein [Bryobacteraceae bacterium]
MRCVSGRVLAPEILDTLPYEQARATLADLTRINRRWGGHSTLRHLLRENVRPEETFSMLDVGAASGDMADCVREWYPRATVVLLDRIASHLNGASGPRVAADAFHLPLRPKSFDFVFCSLFLHHFTGEEIVRLLEAFSSVARRAVLVIDLERNPVAYYFLPWTRRLFGWDPVTVNDGRISVEAAFRAGELEELARRAHLNPKARVFRPAFRIAMTARVPL